MPLPDDVAAAIDLDTTALLFIDVQRRHMDHDQGYHLVPRERAAVALERGAAALRHARAIGMRVVHVGTWTRLRSPWGQVDGGNPFMRWQTGKTVPGTDWQRRSDLCVEGSVYAEFMPGFEPIDNEPLIVKHRYSGFYATDLERVLRTLGVETLFVGGVNTNNCVLATTFDAHARDFRVVVLEDACGSMNGERYHQAALDQIRAALAWTITVDDFTDLVTSKSAAVNSASAATPAATGAGA